MVIIGHKPWREVVIIKDGNLEFESTFDFVREVGVYQFDGITEINGESVHFYSFKG